MTTGASHSVKKIIRNSYGVIDEIVRQNPHIESVTLVTYEENPSWRDAAAQKAPAVPLRLKGLEQDRGSRVLTKLARTEVSANNLYKLTRNLAKSSLLGFCSNVQLADGQIAHIPMMDFMCRPTAKNLALLIRLIRNLHQGPGCLLHSGNSYHYYGFQLLRNEQWKVFLGKCLLMSGFADDRYIGHQLVDGYCVLRLSSGKLKTSVPTVVAEVP